MYRLIVISYFILLPSYFWYRWLYTIEWDVPYRMYYQTTVCVAEMFGAICVMMLAVIRFPLNANLNPPLPLTLTLALTLTLTLTLAPTLTLTPTLTPTLTLTLTR